MKAKWIYITDRTQLAAETALLTTMEANLRAGIGAVYLRERDLACDCYEKLASEALALCRRHSAQLILPGDCEFADRVPEDVAFQLGTHRPSLKEARARFGPRRLLGFSAHSLGDVRLGNLLGANYLFLSPIFPTSSKPGQKPLGLEALRSACGESDVPLFALGGVAAENLQDVLGAGAQGAAMVSALQVEPQRVWEKIRLA